MTLFATSSSTSMNSLRRWALVAALATSAMALLLWPSSTSPTSAAASSSMAAETGKKATERIGAKPRRKPSPPHIVFILADDLGHNDLGFSWTDASVEEPPLPFATHGRIPTPHIDALVAQPGSVVLSDVYSMPMCTPTRAALLTGVHPTKLGLHHFVLLASQGTGLPLGVPTLPEKLKERHGYATHVVGKWHLGFARRAFLPTRRGFDSFYGYTLGAQDYYTHDSDEFLSGLRADAGLRRPTPGALGHDYWRQEVPVGRAAVDGKHGSGLIAGEAAAVIARHGALVARAEEREAGGASPEDIFRGHQGGEIFREVFRGILGLFNK